MNYMLLIHIMIIIYIISKLKMFGKFFEIFFDRWNLNFEFENMTVGKSKNNGPIEIKKAGYDWRFKLVIYHSNLKIIIFITVKNPLYMQNWTFTGFWPQKHDFVDFLYFQI